MLANLAKATVMVVDSGKTRRRELEGAVKRLTQANTRLVGAVLTKVGRAGKGYGDGYGYGYGYGYSYDYMYGYGNRGADKASPEAETA